MTAIQHDSCRCYRCLRYLALPATYTSRTLSGTLLSAPVGDVMGWFICEDCLDTRPPAPQPRRRPMELPLCLSCECVMDGDRNPIRQRRADDELEAVEYSAFALCVECEPIPAN